LDAGERAETRPRAKGYVRTASRRRTRRDLVEACGAREIEKNRGWMRGIEAIPKRKSVVIGEGKEGLVKSGEIIAKGVKGTVWVGGGCQT